jgi:hypothetical protein
MREPPQHRLPLAAAGDDREAAMLRRLEKCGLGEPGHRDRTAFAPREEAGVAEAADQDRVRLRGELRRAEIANACLEHLVRDGVDTVNGREAPWSPLASRLAGQFASEQGELTAIVSAMAGFRLNVARDVIAMPPHRFAG